MIMISTPTRSDQDPELNAIDFYESQIAFDETCIRNYWHLGVAYLLAGREEDAQFAWFTPLSTATEIDNLTSDLVIVLEQTAKDLVQTSDLEQAWLVRKHIHLLMPDLLENILESIVLAHATGKLTSEQSIEWDVERLLLERECLDDLDEDLLASCLKALIDIPTATSFTIIKSCLQLAGKHQDRLIYRTTITAFNLFHQKNNRNTAIALAEICRDISPENLNTIQALSGFYSLSGIYNKAVEAVELYTSLAPDIVEKLFASYLIQNVNFTAGNWEKVEKRITEHRRLLSEIIELFPHNLSYGQIQKLVVSSFFSPYIEDKPKVNKLLQNQLASICQQNIGLLNFQSELDETSLKKKTDCLRIGYIGSTFKTHSVGLLSRWLIHHHDRQSFQIFVYSLNLDKDDEFNHHWFRDKVDVSYYFTGHPQEVAAQIQEDEIDILIELDSLTFDLTCLVTAYKPAPVQVSWLGWDSSGIPAIDYFLADPYVLPDDAQEYYQEQIWRLPDTYLAVEGFEVGIPTLRRADLNIPSDAVVYFSSQSGYKRHPDNIRCQMEIIKAVPNSYFLIKGKSDPETIQNFFGKLAAEVGISLDRLRFLDRDINEPIHRANLAIADIVLDTFPYNGATTTLETLWMGIPMVTQVGQQFAARNSYTFMLNAGIEEGIAWSQAEYIEWGIKLGLDRDLRDKIAGKLRSGRTTAPVWNAKQFTLDMEQAYREMWAIYQEQNSHQAVEDYSNN
jgi:predicted O-linked N-acetylglucosamine transferase (SPINDLY family)